MFSDEDTLCLHDLVNTKFHDRRSYSTHQKSNVGIINERTGRSYFLFKNLTGENYLLFWFKQIARDGF